MRRLGGLLAEDGFGAAALLRLGRRAARADAALAARACAVRTGLAARRNSDGFRADISALVGEPEEILLRFLADEIKLINGCRPVRLDRLEALVPRFGDALRAGIAFAATLGGAVLRLQSNHFLVIAREGVRSRPSKQTRPEL